MEAAGGGRAGRALSKHCDALLAQHEPRRQNGQRHQQRGRTEHERHHSREDEDRPFAGEGEACGAHRYRKQADQPRMVGPREPLHLSKAIMSRAERLPNGVGVGFALELERDRLLAGVERQRNPPAELRSGRADQLLAGDLLDRHPRPPDLDLTCTQLESRLLRGQPHQRADDDRRYREQCDGKQTQATGASDERGDERGERRDKRQPADQARRSRVVDPRAHPFKLPGRDAALRARSAAGRCGHPRRRGRSPRRSSPASPCGCDART